MNAAPNLPPKSTAQRRTAISEGFLALALITLICSFAAGMSSVPERAANLALTPPPGALAAGYTRLVFQEEFDNNSGIDLHDTRKPGFHFYPKLEWGNYTLPAKCIKVQDGVLHLFNPNNHAQGDLFSAVQTGAGEYTGFAVAGGAYFEASIAFDPLYKKKHPATAGFPAFWSNPVEHHFVRPREPFDYLEMDHLEYFPWEYPDHPSYYFNALIKWTASEGKLKSDFVDPVWANRMVSTPPGTDYNRFNTFGSLWVPGATGRVDSYFNNELRRSLKCADYPTLRSGDQQHFMVILGCGQWPMRVDWVRVWAAPQ
ncbi:MAG TPA: hypothetical protein VHP11_10170 [Tepidisphaeraceae bacterium]|nr:hypothetical protein [Tepidisphaeraceae bacterium]